MALERLSPWKSTSGLRPSPDGGPFPSLGLKLLIEAQLSSSVPSTVKWSGDSSRLRLASESTASKNCRATSCSSSRCLFFEKVEESKASSSMFRSRNHLKRRS